MKNEHTPTNKRKPVKTSLKVSLNIDGVWCMGIRSTFPRLESVNRRSFYLRRNVVDKDTIVVDPDLSCNRKFRENIPSLWRGGPPVQSEVSLTPTR